MTDYAELIERLHDSRYLYNAGLFEACGKAANAIETLQARNKELEADAARYRWLREQWFLDDGWLQSTECAFLESPEEFDESIDAAMKEAGK